MAIDCGALLPIRTQERVVEDGGVRFVVRVVDSLARKDSARQAAVEQRPSGATNPFLPPDPQLFVTPVSKTHCCVLNKFNVLRHHVLIVTREFQHQDEPLTHADFEAMWACLAEGPGLAFYNGGRVAGASQPHKHIQVVPLPLSDFAEELPITSVLPSNEATEVTSVGSLPFSHAFRSLSTTESASSAHGTYWNMMSHLGITSNGAEPRPYNLLITRDWMFMIPRSKEFFGGISVNSLGFAGGLLARNEQQLELITQAGPMRILEAVGLKTLEKDVP